MGYKESIAGKSFVNGRRKSPLDDIINVHALAQFLGCGTDTVSEYIKEDCMPFMPLGRDRYFSSKSLWKWFKARETTLVPEKKLREVGKVSSKVKEVAK